MADKKLKTKSSSIVLILDFKDFCRSLNPNVASKFSNI